MKLKPHVNFTPNWVGVGLSFHHCKWVDLGTNQWAHDWTIRIYLPLCVMSLCISTA